MSFIFTAARHAQECELPMNNDALAVVDSSCVTHTQTHTDAHTHTHAHAGAHARTHTHTRTHIRTQAHTHTNMHIDKYTHTHTHAPTLFTAIVSTFFQTRLNETWNGMVRRKEYDWSRD